MAKQCERCGSGVADTAEKCQICGAPMSAPPPAAQGGPTPGAPVALGGNADPEAGIPGIPTPSATPAPTPNYLQPTAGAGSIGGDIRTSLTGEVMEVAQPTPRGTGPGGYGPPPGAPQPKGRGPAPAAPSRRYAGMPTEAAPAKSGSGGMVAIILVVLLLAGGGAFGWWWWQKQQGPARTAAKLMEAAKANDWKAVFNTIELSPEGKQQMDQAGGVDKAADAIGNMMKMMGVTIKDYKIGETTVEGDTATVKVTVTVAAMGQERSNTQDMKLKRVNGEWKVDGTSAGAGLGGLGGMGGGGMGGMGGGR